MERQHRKNMLEAQNGQGIERSTSVIEMKRTEGYDELYTGPKEFYSDSRSKSYYENLDGSYEANMMKNAMSKEGSSNEDNENVGLYDNLQPVINSSSQSKEEQTMLTRIISNTDVASLDATLKRLSYNLDLTQMINKENGYTLLHLAVFKDSDQIVYAL